jgi:hypothetical protein
MTTTPRITADVQRLADGLAEFARHYAVYPPGKMTWREWARRIIEAERKAKP